MELKRQNRYYVKDKVNQTWLIIAIIKNLRIISKRRFQY